MTSFGKCAFRTHGAALALVAAMTAAPAFAQETAQPDQASGQAGDQANSADIIVTAQFRAQNLQDTPIAITAVSADTLAARSQTSVTDLGQFAPNVALAPATSIQGNSVAAFIRGVGQLDASFALEPGVGIYVDDIYYGTTFGAVMDLTDLERVEVLRGPQGTLAGKNSVGGAVKLFSKKPDSTPGGFIEATYGRFDRIELRGSANIPLTNDLFLRVSGVSKNVDGYMSLLDYGCVNPTSGIPASSGNKNCKIGTEGGIDVMGLRAALRYAPAGSPLEINIVGDVSRDNSEVVATKLLYADNPSVRSYDASDATAGIPFDSRFLTGAKSYTSYATYATGGNYTTAFGIPTQVAPGGFTASPTSTVKAWGLSGTIDYDLSDSLKLKSITGWREAHGTSAIDVDGSPLAILLQQFTYGHEQFTQELRLSANFNDLVDLTVGGFYYSATDTIKGRSQIPTLLFDFMSDDVIKNRSVSAFAHGEFHVTDAFNIIGGLRYTDDKKTYRYSRRNVDGSLPSGAFFTPNFLLAGLDGLTGTFKGDRLDYRLGVNYRWSGDLMTYAQISTGFKGGGINPRPSAPDQVLTFGPETLTTYEAGFKADLLGRMLRLNGAVFLNKYKDMQLVRYQCPESVVLSCSVPSNAGDAQVFGWEAEAQFHPADGLSIDASVGYLDFDYTKITNAATLVTKDMIAPFISKWQLSAGIQYEADLGGNGTLTPRIDWSWRSNFYYNSVNNAYNLIDPPSLVNARLTYQAADKDWSLSAGVTNLFDKFYYNGVAENVGTFGVVTGTVGRPREWTVTVKKNF
ncbi:iron complex outermembrane recepter protein [Sphingobium sp. AP50]|uniref:TonB-dependent receptor n=1 Tax=Sphingobium sp. AP50 TaxID=1884369 RepID=UPI0008B59B16|nr:TonB-dependent receptor [Sphingobium sp. AP50]SEJ93903.1 iron complex outermembrane recepter protein [Sphingobium sp. AP50]